MSKTPYDDDRYVDDKQLHVKLYRVDGDDLTFEQIVRSCPHVTEKMLRDRLFRGENKMSRLSRPPDSRKNVDKPKSWR